MPIRNSPTILLAEDAAGALSAQVRVSAEDANGLVAAPITAAQAVAGQPIPQVGLFAYQRRPAGAAMYAIGQPPASGALGGQPAMIVPAGSSTAAMTPIPYQSESFEDDGLPQVTGEVVDAQAGRLGPIAVPGVYRIGVNFHGGDPVAVKPNEVGQYVHVAVRVVGAPSTADPNVLRNVGGVIRLGSGLVVSLPGPNAVALAAFPFIGFAQYATSTLWPLTAGSVVEYSVRQSTASAAYGGSPGQRPYLFNAWAYMVQPF